MNQIDLSKYREEDRELLMKIKKRTWKSFFFKIVKKDGNIYHDYQFERAREIFERDGGRFYAYTRNLFPVTILIDYK